MFYRGAHQTRSRMGINDSSTRRAQNMHVQVHTHRYTRIHAYTHTRIHTGTRTDTRALRHNLCAQPERSPAREKRRFQQPHLLCDSAVRGSRCLRGSFGLKRLSNAGGKYALMVPVVSPGRKLSWGRPQTALPELNFQARARKRVGVSECGEANTKSAKERWLSTCRCPHSSTPQQHPPHPGSGHSRHSATPPHLLSADHLHTTRLPRDPGPSSILLPQVQKIGGGGGGGLKAG
jgi:hypothetical protein